MHLGRVEERAERLLPAALVALGGVEDLGPAAVVEGDEQRDPVVGRGRGLGPLHLGHELGVDALAAPHEAHPHALLVQLDALVGSEYCPDA